MDVKITKFDVEQVIKNNGIQIDVYEPNEGERRGDLTVTKLSWFGVLARLTRRTGLRSRGINSSSGWKAPNANRT